MKRIVLSLIFIGLPSMIKSMNSNQIARSFLTLYSPIAIKNQARHIEAIVNDLTEIQKILEKLELSSPAQKNATQTVNEFLVESHDSQKFDFKLHIDRGESEPTYALHLKNQFNPAQKIIIIGTQHSYPLNKYPSKLIRRLKSSDILVSEIGNGKTRKITSITDELNSCIMTHRKQLLAACKLEPYMYDNKPWTEQLTQEDNQFLAELFEQSLCTFKLENLSPQAIIKILFTAASNFANSGVDNDLQYFFSLAKKPVFALETQQDRKNADMQSLSSSKSTPETCDLKNYIKNFDIKKFKELILFVKQLQKVNSVNERTKLFLGDDYHQFGIDLFLIKYEKETDIPVDVSTIYRNKLWITNLLKILKDNPDKSITIAVGVGHFWGKDSFLHLLEENGFTFERFK